MAQSAEQTCAETSENGVMDGQRTAKAEESHNTSRITNSGLQTCESLVRDEGRKFTMWWENRVLNRHTARSGWTPNDFGVLKLIRDAYELSTGAESWGCLCEEDTYWEICNRRTKGGKTGTKGQITTRTRSEKSKCANDASPPHMRKSDAVRVEHIYHGLICKEETLQMVSDHVADMTLRAIGETPTEPWYIGQTSSNTNHDVNGNNDTKGIPDLREDRHLRTSVWIVKATACIIA